MHHFSHFHTESKRERVGERMEFSFLLFFSRCCCTFFMSLKRLPHAVDVCRYMRKAARWGLSRSLGCANAMGVSPLHSLVYIICIYIYVYSYIFFYISCILHASAQIVSLFMCALRYSHARTAWRASSAPTKVKPTLLLKFSYRPFILHIYHWATYCTSHYAAHFSAWLGLLVALLIVLLSSPFCSTSRNASYFWQIYMLLNLCLV